MNKIENSKCPKAIKLIFAVIMCILAATFVIKTIAENSSYNKSNENNKMTSKQQEAIVTLKSGYDGAKTNGFEVIHSSICEEISGMFKNKLNCRRLPLYVNALNDDEITIYHTFTCYKLKIDTQNQVISKEKKYIGNDTQNECDGLPIGVMYWDNNNEYYQKIGGYEKIRRMAIDSYNYNAMLNPSLFDYRSIGERGGNPASQTEYKMNADMFFAGLTGRGYSIQSDTTKEEFEKMVENYYYIMKE